MEESTKTQIARLSESGKSHAEIAEALGIPVGSVKTVLHRSKPRCEACGKPLAGRQRRFCSDECRYRWWKTHRDCGERTCPACGKAFTAKDKRRVYCCRECYHKVGGKGDAGEE